MQIKNAKFLTTVVDKSKILTETKNEIAFVGRSNVGKSSLINALTNQKKLAKTSGTPGLTKNLNYFSLNNGQFHIVDLPGYGYHQAGKKEEKKWSILLENYLLNSPNLKCVFVLLDIRHEPSELDRIMVSFLIYHNIPFIVVATKIDKLSKSQQGIKLERLANSLRLTKLNIISVSSETRQNLNLIIDKIEQFID